MHSSEELIMPFTAGAVILCAQTGMARHCSAHIAVPHRSATSQRHIVTAAVQTRKRWPSFCHTPDHAARVGIPTLLIVLCGRERGRVRVRP